MKVVERALNGLIVFKPTVFSDDRGVFFESYSESVILSEIGHENSFVQDNHSVSKKNVVRGLHFQSPPYAQGKLVRVVNGAALDVAVDIRVGSPTYGKAFSVELNLVNNYIFWIPPGFAHGFSSLKEETVFLYKCTAMYNKSSEGTILFNDQELDIDWKVKSPIVSEKDLQGTAFSQFKSPFVYR